MSREWCRPGFSVRSGKRRLALVIAGALAVGCAACSAPARPASGYWLGKPPSPRAGLPPLPAPAAMPPGTADLRADVLAAEVESGPAALRSLLTALSASGVTVQAADGSLLLPPQHAPGQGIVLNQAQVEVLAMFARHDTSVPLTSLVTAIGKGVPFLRAAPAAADIVAGLRSNAVSADPQARFFARFVIGLIAHSQHRPANLMTIRNPAGVSVDGVAMELIIIRVAADLNAMRLQASTATSAGAAPAPTAILAAARGSLMAGPGDAGPCHLSENESQTMDAAANAATIGFDKLTEYLKEHLRDLSQQQAVRAISGFTTGANILFALAKVLAYVASTDVSITAQPAPPLVRTKSQYAYGARAVLTATQTLELNNASQLINCFRIMLNPVGIDLSVPQSGAVEGAQVIWECWQGCRSSGYSNATGLTGEQPFVEFTRADPANPATGDTQHQRTNAAGQSSIGIEGLPQKEPLPDRVRPLPRQAEIVARIQLKPPSLSQDLIDALGGFSFGAATAGDRHS